MLQLLHLATFSDDPNPAVTRLVFSENDMHARKYVVSSDGVLAHLLRVRLAPLPVPTPPFSLNI